MPSLNLGVLAHVDAGKTSLTERLLFAAGAITDVGSVDAGTTRTDSMDLERQRGITIRAAVTTLRLGELDVNVLDTPGHPDFIAEVERSLIVLDAAVLVLSSVEGVQPQTVILWRALRRLGVPTALFVNKIDRSGADVERVTEQIRRRLSSEIVVLSAPVDQGRPNADAHDLSLDEDSVLEAVAAGDDEVMREWVDTGTADARAVLAGLRRGIARGALFPVLYGSAVTGAGVDALERVITTLLPTTRDHGPELSAAVFAVNHDDRGRRAWLRLWGGQLRLRDTVGIRGHKPLRVTELAVSTPDGARPTDLAGAGDIAAVRGLSTARIGDVIGTPPERRTPKFPPATMQASVEAVDPTQRGALFAALGVLGDEDPLIEPELNEIDGNAWVRIHGEVQKEVIAAVLADRFGVEAEFRDTSVVCVERVAGAGEAVEEIGRDDNPYLATIGLRVARGDEGSGIVFDPGVERGNLPASFVTACEEGVRAALAQGLRGWAVTDCAVTLTRSAYYPRQSHAHQAFNKAMSTVGADFRNLAPVVVMACLEQARTVVCEPVESYELDAPQSSMQVLMATLGRLRATPLTITEGGDYTRLTGHIASARMAELAAALPNITGGEGVLVTEADHYSPVTEDDPPARPRSGVDPRRRTQWFRAMPR